MTQKEKKELAIEFIDLFCDKVPLLINKAIESSRRVKNDGWGKSWNIVDYEEMNLQARKVISQINFNKARFYKKLEAKAPK